MSNKEIVYCLTEPQKRIWYTQMVYPDSPMFNIGGSATIFGEIDVDILRKAISAFVASHDAFKIRLTVKDSEPMQYFCEDSPEEIMYINFRGKADNESLFKDWIRKKAADPFLLENRPLYHFSVFSLNDNTHGYFVKLHHIIADGWSIQILGEEISRNYSMLATGAQPQTQTSDGYRKFIQSNKDYLDSHQYDKDKVFWNEMYAPLPDEKTVELDSIKGKRHTFYLPKDKINALHEFCNKNRITLNAFFVNLYLLYINKVTGNDDIVIGNPVLGRSGRRERQVIGMYVSSMPVRYTIDDSISIIEMLQEVNRRIKKCFSHQKYPYNHLVKDLKVGMDSLYTACVNYYSTSMCKEFNGFPINNTEFYNGEQQYDIQLIIREWSDTLGIQIDVDYKMERFSKKQIDDMIHRLEILMEAIFANADKKISEVCLLSHEDKKMLIEDYNDTVCRYPDNKSVIDLFVQQAVLTPDRIAVYDNGIQITYKELDKRSTCLALFLQEKGITRNTVVGLLTTHSIETIVGILGILKARCAYLPIDPQCPMERLEFMLQDASVDILLTNMKLQDDSVFLGEILNLNYEKLYENRIVTPVFFNHCHSSNDIAYIIYTSGSTGRPKGVIIEHHTLFNYIYWARSQYVTLDQEIFPLYTSLSFDLTVTSIFAPLVSGGTIRVYRDDEDEYILKRILKDDSCTIIKITPAHLTLVKEYDNWPSNIHTLIVGGDNLKTDLAKEIYEGFEGRVAIYNEYGPTEATVGCMIYRYDPRKGPHGSVPIGKPIDNCHIYILDNNFNPMPIGLYGELYISGKGIARGYLNQIELTFEKFINNNFFEEGNILYKSGDVARFIDNHTIEYCGRKDSQIKIRGYRIELGEIEDCICRYPNVENAIVVEYEEENKTQFLCAYYVSKTKNDEEKMRRFLSRNLPLYMIPAFLIHMERFSLTTNGKVNKEHLPMPIITYSVQKDDSIDQQYSFFTSVFSDVLGKYTIQIDDNFYHMGGDSIKAIQISSRFHEQGYTLKVKDILSTPVLRDMLFYLSEDKGMEIEQGICEGNVEATPIIRWFFLQKLHNPSDFCQGIILELKQSVPVNILEQILAQIVKHHDMLRVNWNPKSDSLIYNNKYLYDPFIIKEWDIHEIAEENLEEEIIKKRRLLIDEMDIVNSLLVSSFLCHTRKGDIWCIVIHHLAVDAVSWRILLEDIQKMLNQYLREQEFQLPLKTHSFQRWAEFQLKSCDTGQIARDMVYGQAPLPSKIAEFDIVPYYETVLVVGKDTTSKLITTANEAYHTKPIELMLASTVLALYEISIMSDLRMEIESHGRDVRFEEINIARTVGWFTNLMSFSLENVPRVLTQMIISIKEIYRNLIKNGINQSWTDRDKSEREPYEKLVRFNFLGEYQTEFDLFTLQSSLYNQNEITADMEIDAILAEKQLQISLRVKESFLPSLKDTEDFSAVFLNQLHQVIEHCINRDEVHFMPSDFDKVTLTREDLDELFE